MALISYVYRTAIKRTSAFAFVIMGGAYVFERVFDQAVDSFYEYHNRGKLWIHIRDKVGKPADA